MKFTVAISAICLASATAFAPAANVARSTAIFSGNPFDGPSLQYTGGSDPNNANYVKLSDALSDQTPNAARQQKQQISVSALQRSVVKNVRRKLIT